MKKNSGKKLNQTFKKMPFSGFPLGATDEKSGGRRSLQTLPKR